MFLLTITDLKCGQPLVYNIQTGCALLALWGEKIRKLWKILRKNRPGSSSSSQPSRGRRSPWASPPCSTWRWPFFLSFSETFSGTPTDISGPWPPLCLFEKNERYVSTKTDQFLLHQCNVASPSYSLLSWLRESPFTKGILSFSNGSNQLIWPMKLDKVR